MSNQGIIVFTDGACLGNPGPGGWGSIVFIASAGRVVELGGYESPTTNNRMEISAALEAFRFLNSELGSKDLKAEVLLYSDSAYFISGITEWIHGWKKRGWKTRPDSSSGEVEDIKNRDLWEQVHEEFEALKKKGLRFQLKRIAGHIGIPGNERCDEIATTFAKGKEPKLFDGRASDYSVSLQVSEELSRISSAKSKRSGPGAYYLSVVGGKVFRDKTWADCEARVKGQRGCKYKKVSSESEEKSALRSWGLDP